MQSWTSAGYFSNSTDSFVTSCQFSPIIDPRMSFRFSMNNLSQQSFIFTSNFIGIWTFKRRFEDQWLVVLAPMNDYEPLKNVMPHHPNGDNFIIIVHLRQPLCVLKNLSTYLFLHWNKFVTTIILIIIIGHPSFKILKKLLNSFTIKHRPGSALVQVIAVNYGHHLRYLEQPIIVVLIKNNILMIQSPKDS